MVQASKARQQCQLRAPVTIAMQVYECLFPRAASQQYHTNQHSITIAVDDVDSARACKPCYGFAALQEQLAQCAKAVHIYEGPSPWPAP